MPPGEGRRRICPICDESHEAAEFAHAVLFVVLDPFTTESPELRNLLVHKGYARQAREHAPRDGLRA